MNTGYYSLADGTIVDSKNRIIVFSLEKFIKDIAKGNCCFVCGLSPDDVTFNDEHVIPDWVLKLFSLQSRSIVLPNNRSVIYSKYKVPCCIDCNLLLGHRVENPIRNLLAFGYDSLMEKMKEDDFALLFIWLNLIFLKTHLKDRDHRILLDLRESDEVISNVYDWESLYHIHCIARVMYTGGKIKSNVFGSILIFKLNENIEHEKFDYGDNIEGKGILIRLGNIMIVAILNDSQFSALAFKHKYDKIDGQLSQLQAREILAELSFINVNLSDRPTYFSECDVERGYIIYAKVPKQFRLKVGEPELFGRFLYSACHDSIKRLNISNKEELLESIISGEWSFLFDKEGKFIKN